MKKPIIGIVAKSSKFSDMWTYTEIVDDIRMRLIENNALIIGILPTDRKTHFKKDDDVAKETLSNIEIEDLELILKTVDGVVLEGGLTSNKYEEEIARICLEKDIPILGICSGFNNLARALGGSVFEKFTDTHKKYGHDFAHEVTIDKSSRLYKILKQEKLTVNSIHTFLGTPQTIKNCKITAICEEDNTVEAFEVEDKKFAMGIKWHPEIMKDMDNIFKTFVEACGENNEI